ncbi:tumor necrosis factor-like [Lampris incognitus]|uniref:tumor necrosis factor-like n=1 Tax=Lampris incognitus TaxID=2546036 RepID=UPI0024B58570|nr:tumor necrosis factor-like [Lampris incognitus]XP_056154875.1 tumor necrosis factor-like [Lampris incognitus]XP_056154876.1 tumor necrosis factor-like [Lampris incognitus]
MEGHHEVLLDVDTSEQQDVKPSQQPSTPSSRHRRRLAAALVAMALCVAGAVFFSWHAKEQSHTEQDGDLRHMLRQISGNIRAAIHVEGEYNASFKDSAEWKRDVNQFHSQGHLKLVNNEIVIPQDGLYFVYSQASFQVSCNSHDEGVAKQEVHLSHIVKRWSKSFGISDPNNYETILHSIRTACEQRPSSGPDSGPDSGGNWFSAVYMGAVFSLMKEDRIRTVTEPRLLPNLDDDPGKTFFGVFSL